MYHRNISHVLYPAAGILALFIVYEALVRPTYVRSPEPVQTEEDAPTSQAMTPELTSEPPPDEPREPPPKQLRLIDPGGVPDTQHRESLEDIRDEIEKGNLKVAETKLVSLPASMQADSQIRLYLAILWNNLGIEQEKHEGTKGSIKAFKKAASLDANNPVIHLNLAHAYWEQRDPAMTQDFLERLMTLAPGEPFPHVALADMLQERDRLGEATHHLDQAAERAANDPSMQLYLRAVTAKVRRAEQSEGRFSRLDGAHFTVKYDGTVDQDTWPVVLEILEEAYREIGQKFGHFPSKTIVVVLHAKDTFQSVTGSPVWADGLFDSVLGRIQVPTLGALTDRAWLKRVLRHEFVHALLHDQQGLDHNALPTWLNEGLAMQLSGDHWSDMEQLAQHKVPVIPLTALEGGWGELSGEAASIAYLEANSAARYMINRYGMHEVQQLLARLKKKQTLATAMQNQLSLSYDQFQLRWMEQRHEERRKSQGRIESDGLFL
jgi:tetratricopeptide (TPR) repeat protein